MEGQESSRVLCSGGVHGTFRFFYLSFYSPHWLSRSANSQPTCHVNHLPPYIEKFDEFKAKGVDVIAVLAVNDAFVMSGWGRVEGVKDKVSPFAPDVISCVPA